MRASIIIPVFNKYDLTRNCLRSLQQTAPGAEVIVIDNASSDETATQLPGDFPHVRYYRQDVNHGYARGNNIGSSYALGDFIILLNNDTITEAGWLEPLLSTFTDQPKAGVVGARLLFPQRHVQHAGIAFNGSGDPFHIYRNAPEHFPRVTRLRRYPAVTGACFVMPRELYRTMGGMSEDYHNGFEDIDLCLRLAGAGYEIWYQGASTVIHLESQTPGRKKFEYENQQIFYRRWRSKIQPDWTKHYQDDGFEAPLHAMIDRLAQSAELSRYVPEVWRCGRDTATRALVESWGETVVDETVQEGVVGTVRSNNEYLKYDLFVSGGRPGAANHAGGLTVAPGQTLGLDAHTGAKTRFPPTLSPLTALQLLSVNLRANDARFIAGQGLKRLGRPGFDSTRYATEFAQLWPQHVETLKFKTAALIFNHDLPGAIERLAAFYQEDRHNTWVTLRLAELLTQSGQRSEAADMLSEFLKVKPFHLRARSLALKAQLTL